MIVEVIRPYPFEAFEHLPSETTVQFGGFEYWCATARIARVVEAAARGASLDDTSWLCSRLNDGEIQDALKLSGDRQHRLKVYNLKKKIAVMQAHDADISSNPEIAALLDDPDELKGHIQQAQAELLALENRRK